MQSDLTVSVIIPARDAASTLSRTLEAIQSQEFDQPFEVIVVDDGSHDETATIAARYQPLVRLIRNERSEGAGAARNRGVRAARAPVLAFTDADCFPTAQWLAHGLEAITPGALVQGRVEPDPQATRRPFDRTLVVDRDETYYQTANLFVPRQLFDAVGGFKDWSRRRPSALGAMVTGGKPRPERPVGEDTQFAWAARRLGAGSKFASDALVHHAVVPGGIRDAVADRWNWASRMPAMVRLVPELRDRAFYRRWFFNAWTAQFDAAVAGLLGAAVSRRKLWLVLAFPYTQRVLRQSRRWHVKHAPRFVVGSVIEDTTTLAAFIVGSITSGRLVL